MKSRKRRYLTKKKDIQQVERGDSPPLLDSPETPPGLLHPALRSPSEEQEGHVGVSPEEGYKEDQRAGTPSLC